MNIYDKKSESVSQREFARLCGKNQTWVRRRIADETLPVNPDGTVSLKEGFEAFKKIVGETATKTKKVTERLSEVKAGKDGRNSLSLDDLGLASVDFSNVEEVAHAYSIAKLLEKQANANVKAAEMRLKSLELEAKNGILVRKEDVVADAQRVATLVRERLLTIPVRYAGLLEGRTQREIESVLEQAVDEVLNEFQKSGFIRK